MSANQESVNPGDGRTPLIRLAKIEKWYGTVHALRGVSVDVYPGEIVGLIGDNGAGKSTLIKIISGVLPFNAGEISWKGEPVAIRNVKAARRLGIETVYQDRAVIGTMTVAENIFMGREPVKSFLFIKRLDKPAMRENALKLSTDLRLNIPSPDQQVRFCSGGEMQGVAISRAMYFRASLVILDEPTTALAVSGVQRVLSFIRRLKTEGIACMFVTHNLHDVHEVADRFIVMRQGAVVANRRKEEVSVEDLIDLQLVDQGRQ